MQLHEGSPTSGGHRPAFADTYTRCGEGNQTRRVTALQMVGRPHAVDDLRLQLRRPPGDLLGLSAARTRDAADAGAARAPRFRLRMGLWPHGAARRHRRRSSQAQDRDSRRSARVEHHLHGDGAVAELPPPVFLSRCRGPRRDVLFSGVDVSSRRLPRPGHSFAGDGIPPDERLCRNHWRRLFRRADRSALRLAAVVHRFWRARRPPRYRIALAAGRAATRRSGTRRAGGGRSAGREREEADVCRVRAPRGADTHAPCA